MKPTIQTILNLSFLALSLAAQADEAQPSPGTQTAHDCAAAQVSGLHHLVEQSNPLAALEAPQVRRPLSQAVQLLQANTGPSDTQLKRLVTEVLFTNGEVLPNPRDAQGRQLLNTVLRSDLTTEFEKASANGDLGQLVAYFIKRYEALPPNEQNRISTQFLQTAFEKRFANSYSQANPHRTQQVAHLFFREQSGWDSPLNGYTQTTVFTAEKIRASEAAKEVANDLFPSYLRALKAEFGIDSPEAVASQTCRALQIAVPRGQGTALCVANGLSTPKPGFFSRFKWRRGKQEVDPNEPDSPYVSFKKESSLKYSGDGNLTTNIEASWNKFAQSADDLEREFKDALQEYARTQDDLAFTDVVRVSGHRLLNINQILSHFQELDLPNGLSLQQIVSSNGKATLMDKDQIRDIARSSIRRLEQLNAVKDELMHLGADVNAISQSFSKMMASLSQQDIPAARRALIAERLTMFTPVIQAQEQTVVRTIQIVEQAKAYIEQIEHFARMAYIEQVGDAQVQGTALRRLEEQQRHLQDLLKPAPKPEG